MAIAAFSTVVEWYDFTLYLYMATVLSRVFYGGGAGSLTDTLAGFALAYLMRPLGALAFGMFGDRFGRRRTLLLSMMAMSAAMLATAMLPTYAQVGPIAGWALLALRCVMAFSVGGEYTGVVAYLLEGAPARRRGLITSTAAAASELGGLLAAGAAALSVGMLDRPDLDHWGWRIPFLIGAVMAGGVWLARSGMEESPEFERQRESGSVPAAPLRSVLRHQRPGIVRGFAISALGSITYYVGITYVPAFLSALGTVEEADALRITTLAALAVILVTPVTGILADRLGRRPVLLGLAALGALLPTMLFAAMASSGLAVATAGALALALLGGGVSAVGAVATAEQFPGEGRLTGLALGVTMATAIFGGLAPLAAHLIVERTGWAAAPGALIAIVAIAVLPWLWGMPETRPAGPD
jgi:MHS family proline/betaine transporter-like MFS transporter